MEFMFLSVSNMDACEYVDLKNSKTKFVWLPSYLQQGFKQTVESPAILDALMRAWSSL